MGPVTALRSFYGRYFDVYGRSRRFEYFWILFIQTIGGILGMILIVLSEGSLDGLESGDLNLFSMSILGVMVLWSVAKHCPVDNTPSPPISRYGVYGLDGRSVCGALVYSGNRFHRIYRAVFLASSRQRHRRP